MLMLLDVFSCNKRVLTGLDDPRLDVLTAVDRHGDQRQEQDCSLLTEKHFDAVPDYLPTVNDSKIMTTEWRCDANERAPFFEIERTHRVIETRLENSNFRALARRPSGGSYLVNRGFAADADAERTKRELAVAAEMMRTKARGQDRPHHAQPSAPLRISPTHARTARFRLFFKVLDRSTTPTLCSQMRPIPLNSQPFSPGRFRPARFLIPGIAFFSNERHVRNVTSERRACPRLDPPSRSFGIVSQLTAPRPACTGQCESVKTSMTNHVTAVSHAEFRDDERILSRQTWLSRDNRSRSDCNVGVDPARIILH